MAAAVLRRSCSSVNRIRFGVMTLNSSSLCSTTKSSSSSPQPISDVFDSWCQKFEKTYTSEQEKEKRFKVFERNFELVTQHNNKNRPKYSRKVPLNDLADLTDEEFAVQFLGYAKEPNIWPPLPGPIWPFTIKSSPQPISDLFDIWCKKYGKKYASEQEKEKSLKVFEKSYKLVIEHNRSDSSFKVALNQFSGTTKKERSGVCRHGSRPYGDVEMAHVDMEV